MITKSFKNAELGDYVSEPGAGDYIIIKISGKFIYTQYNWGDKHIARISKRDLKKGHMYIWVPGKGFNLRFHAS